MQAKIALVFFLETGTAFMPYNGNRDVHDPFVYFGQK
jgi:hypothetical protein